MLQTNQIKVDRVLYSEPPIYRRKKPSSGATKDTANETCVRFMLDIPTVRDIGTGLELNRTELTFFHRSEVSVGHGKLFLIINRRV